MSSSTTYSSLLRRSKLASYTPSIEQVYSSTGGHLSRSSFGLKRPLPSSTTKISPFVRINALDNSQRRTDFRKATKETLFVRKWAEASVTIGTSSPDAPVQPQELGVQSRYLDAGSFGGLAHLVPLKKAAAGAWTPNIFALSDEQFERFLDGLGSRREEFKAFLLDESAKDLRQESQRMSSDPYMAAQSSPTELNSLLTRFLASTPRPSSFPLPHPHPSLGLQYSTPTPLESALSSPIPGRLLGPIFPKNYKDSSDTRQSGILSSVLSQISRLNTDETAGGTTTTWFPDSTSTRSNLPGRARFTLEASIAPDPLSNRAALSARGNPAYRSRIPAHEPQALAARSINLRPRVFQGAVRPRPGTQAYSGNEPQGRTSGAPMSNMFGQTGRQSGFKGKDWAYQAKRSGAEKGKYAERKGSLIETRRSTDRNVFKTPPRKKSKGGGKTALTDTLRSLLGEE